MALSGLKSMLGIKGESKKKQEAFESSETSPEMEYLLISSLQHLGIPKYTTKTFTYDKIQGLAAVGTLTGSIKIFGKQGIEAIIEGEKQHPIEFLAFITNKGVLVSNSNIGRNLTFWSIEEMKVTLTIPIDFLVSKLYYPEDGDFIYLGTHGGELRVLDVEQKRLTAYGLSFSLLCPDQAEDPIIDLSFHPEKPEKILICYENRGIVIWDFKKNKVIKKINNTQPTHCAAWTRDGNSIVCGLRDGSIAFWNLEEKKPFIYKSLKPDPDVNDINLTAIDTIICMADKTIVMGGQPFNSPNQITCFTGDEINNSFVYTLPSETLPLQIFPIQSIDDGVIKENLVIVTQDASILIHDFKSPYPFYPTEIFGPLQVFCSRYYTMANNGQEVMNLIESMASPEFELVLNGGVVSETYQDIFGMLITAHSSGLIRFWCVSNVRTYNLTNLSLLSQEKNPYFRGSIFIFNEVADENCKISALEISIETKKLIVAFDIGKIGIWQIGINEINLLGIHQVHTSPILDLKVKGSFIISGDLVGGLSIFNMDSSEIIYSYDLKISRKSEISKQQISISQIEIYDNIAAVSVSNGLVHLFDFNTMQLQPPVKSPKIDLKSEVPKRSDVGILKMLYTSIDQQKVVIAYEKSMHLVQWPSLEVQASQYWLTPIVSTNLLYLRSEVYAALLHSDGMMSLLRTDSLERIWKSKISIPIEANYKEFNMSFDGHFIITTSSKQILTGWLTFFDESRAECNLVLFNKNASNDFKKEKKSSKFLGFKVNREVNFNGIFEKPNKKCLIQEKEIVEDRPQEEEKKGLEEEMKMGELGSAMEKALQGVKERGEKIQNLDVKIKNMAEQAKSWADMIKEQAEKEKNKKWWQL
ncbi:STXBP5 [Blepharisma stoltei]|uniref:V-SNARE coiled-coil homology domain-containing protein n=1 Tax=Blepharisma stoltei TaxID=1481888 RepID=A0AAU9IUP0_9CILI|nr:unnamed protein product [Blepharisma stoltei]